MLFFSWRSKTLEAPSSDKSFTKFLNEVRAGILKRASSEEEFYWFMIEIYDYLSGLPNTTEIISGFRLHDIEFRGQKSEDSYPRKINKAAKYFREDVGAILDHAYPKADANALLALTYLLIIVKDSQAVSEIRLKHATHYRNNCIKSSSLNNAAKWEDVVEDTECQEIYVPPFKNYLPWL